MHLRNFCVLFSFRRLHSIKNIPRGLYKQSCCVQVRTLVKMSCAANISDVFEGKIDRYEGVTIHSDKETCSLEEFSEKLKRSIEAWTSSGKRGVWFRVHLDQCDWVPILVKNGFKYHHAKGDYVMLYHWLPKHETNNVPNYAHTMIGVGGVVVNDKDQLLVVKEKHFYKLPMWKLPGGYVEPGENLLDAAAREVFEETGINTEFESLLTIRQTHNGMFECTDLYIVMNLRALNTDIKKCEMEIAECRWMDIEEYLSHPHVHDLNRFFVEKMLHHRKHNIKIDCHHGIHQLLKRPYTVYYAKKEEELHVD